MADPSTPRLVMCRPDYFEVSYAINPWMDPKSWDGDRRELARRSHAEWQSLVQVFTDLGADIELQAPVPGAPNIVFTANAAIVLDGKALLGRFLDDERRIEEPFNEAFFRDLARKGLLDDIRILPKGMFQEGAGDCSWDPTRGHFWAGHGQRSRIEAVDLIEDYFGRRVVPLELVDPKFYHVDTCLSVLSSGHIVYYPPAFSEDSRRLIEREAGGPEWLIAAGKEDAEMLAVNLVNIGGTVVMAACGESLEAAINKVGFKVIRSPLTSFGKSGGAAFCLTLRLDHRSDRLSPRVAA
jgi:N-dimethylarginine dimethylaminohydrolase